MAKDSYGRLNSAADRMGEGNTRVAWEKIDNLVHLFNTAKEGSKAKAAALEAIRREIAKAREAEKLKEKRQED